jgi:PAS domain S-box-containing protein
MVPERSELIESVALSPLAMVVSNPRRADNPIEIANSAFCALTGYGESDIVGRNCRFLAGAFTEERATEAIRAAIRNIRPALVDILNYRSDGTAFRNGVMISPLFDGDGTLAWFLGSQVDLGPHPADAFESRRTRAAQSVEALPPRQQQVLALMAQGLLNKQIAWQLGISEKTVKMHRALLLERLGVATSAEAVRTAVEAGF